MQILICVLNIKHIAKKAQIKIYLYIHIYLSVLFPACISNKFIPFQNIPLVSFQYFLKSLISGIKLLPSAFILPVYFLSQQSF